MELLTGLPFPLPSSPDQLVVGRGSEGTSKGGRRVKSGDCLTTSLPMRSPPAGHVPPLGSAAFQAASLPPGCPFVMRWMRAC